MGYNYTQGKNFWEWLSGRTGPILVMLFNFVVCGLGLVYILTMEDGQLGWQLFFATLYFVIMGATILQQLLIYKRLRRLEKQGQDETPEKPEDA